MTSQQQLVCDSSTLANFKQWASAISGFFTTAGWTQSGDTGQVNWGTIASVPGSAAFVYEIWEPGDGLANFFVKIEYGNFSGTNLPSLRLTISTTTDGAGTPTGFIVGPWNTNFNTFTIPSTTTQYECNFSGDSGRICIMMWRNSPQISQQFFGIERSVNSSGTHTGTHVTLAVVGTSASNTWNAVQHTLVFGVGAAPASTVRSGASNGGLIARLGVAGSAASTTFNGSIPIDTIAPYIGFFDYALTMCGIGSSTDIAEGVTFTATLYGGTRTYMPSHNGPFAKCGPFQAGGTILCMRYD